MRIRLVLALGLFAASLAATAALAQDKKNEREAKVRSDKEHVTTGGAWIYDDLPRGIEEAKETGKPLLVVFRCIPCEACAKIDEDVVDRDPIVAKLLDRYVCVRIPHMNGVDLSVFQFDYDQSWAAFLLNADLSIYGRYGTRSSQKESKDDVSLEGFAKALEGGLALHAQVASDKDLASRLRGKQPTKADVLRPEDLPSLKGKYTGSLDWEGKVVPSCIHCHQVGAALREVPRRAGRDIAAELLFPYPNPKVLGLVMDPKAAARVLSVTPGSSAASDGFRAGEEIVAVGGQPILSVADVQWALHRAGEQKSLDVTVSDGKAEHRRKLTLRPGWRTADDISWRATSWDLRRMTTGGMLLEALSADERAKLGLKDGAMALRAKHVGEYGEHAAAKKAGFVKGDVIVAVDGRTDVMTESAWLTWLVNAKKPGEKVPVTILRDGKKLEMTLPMQ